MFQSQTTNNPGGVTNAAQWQTMQAAGTPDPTWAQQYSDDFNQFLVTLYSLSGVGTPAAALAAGKGGLLNLATTAASGDRTNLQLPVAGFQATPGKHLFFKCGFTPVATPVSDLYIGLFPVSANPAAATDFLGFICATGQANWIFRSRIGSVNTDVAIPTTLTKVDGTAIELGFHVDVQGNIEVFYNPTTGNVPVTGSQSAAGAPRGRVASLQSVVGGTQFAPTQVLLSPTVSLQTNAAVAKNLNLDFLVTSSER